MQAAMLAPRASIEEKRGSSSSSGWPDSRANWANTAEGLPGMATQVPSASPSCTTAARPGRNGERA